MIITTLVTILKIVVAFGAFLLAPAVIEEIEGGNDERTF